MPTTTRPTVRRPARPSLRAAVAAALLALGACSDAAPAGGAGAVGEAAEEGPPLVGTWEGRYPDGMGMRMRFDADGAMTWQIVAPTPGEPFALRYELDRSHEPHHLDVTGFERGPLVGLTLRAIVSFDGPDTFRWDAEPGAADARPADFGPETWTYRRVR